LKIRILIAIVFSGLILVFMGCIGPSGVQDENITATAEKEPKKVAHVKPVVEDAPAYVPGQVLVKLRDGMGVSALDFLSRELGLETIKPLALPGVYLMKITGDDSVDGMVKKLKAYKMVEYGEPNYTLKTE
jgi:hypothetical protein